MASDGDTGPASPTATPDETSPLLRNHTASHDTEDADVEPTPSAEAAKGPQVNMALLFPAVGIGVSVAGRPSPSNQTPRRQ
jgi:hypothetical protein